VFRSTSPYLWLYKYLGGIAVEGPFPTWGTFFAETFSKSTFNQITATGPLNGYTPGTAPQFFEVTTSNMTYTVNDAGKVTLEAFSARDFNVLAGKQYTYK